MSREEENKAITVAMLEATNRGEIDAALEVDAEDITLNGQPFGRERDRQRALMMAAAFPDGKWQIDDLFAEGEKVAVRWTFRGTHQGELLQIPATGKSVEFSGISIYRFVDGRLTEFWEGFDRLGLLQQLGVISR